MIGFPNILFGASVSAPTLLLAFGLLWLSLVAGALALASANGRDTENISVRD